MTGFKLGKIPQFAILHNLRCFLFGGREVAFSEVSVNWTKDYFYQAQQRQVRDQNKYTYGGGGGAVKRNKKHHLYTRSSDDNECFPLFIMAWLVLFLHGVNRYNWELLFRGRRRG